MTATVTSLSQARAARDLPPVRLTAVPPRFVVGDTPALRDRRDGVDDGAAGTVTAVLHLPQGGYAYRIQTHHGQRVVAEARLRHPWEGARE